MVMKNLKHIISFFRYYRNLLSFLLFCLLSSQHVFAAKTDIVVLQNGDKITGEVKQLEFGILEYKTDDIGTLSIQWEKIAQIYAKEFFRIELTDGSFFYGSLDSDTIQSKMVIYLDSFRVSLFFDEVIRITRIKKTFWDRLDLALKLGFDY